MITKRLFIFVLIFAALVGRVYAQQATCVTDTKGDSIQKMLLYFRFDRAVIDSGYMNNSIVLRKLNEILTDNRIILGLDSITITSSSSPDGALERNIKLASQRAKAIKTYITWKYPYLEQSPIIINSISENWDGLKEMIKEDSSTPYRDKVMNILEKEVDSAIKERSLRQIGGGKAYKYISNKMLKYLRSGATTLVFYHINTAEEDVRELETIKEEEVIVNEQPDISFEQHQHIDNKIDNIAAKKEYYMAIKTNLLYDAFGVANIGIEVGVGKHLSLDLPFIYTPYAIKRDYKLQILAIQPELRYWLSTPLKGHFFGIQGTLGWFNVAIDMKNRYQDNTPLYSCGISYGYSLPISRCWGAEFILSGGYTNCNYDIYYNIDNGAKLDQKHLSYWGLTRIGLNLIYKFNLNK